MQAQSLSLDHLEGGEACHEDEGELSDTHILIEEHFYQIKMSLFDKEGHKITLTDNLRFKSLSLDSQWIEIVKTNKIGSELVIKTKKIATDTVVLNTQHLLTEVIPVAQGGEKYVWSASRLTQEKELIITKPVQI